MQYKQGKSSKLSVIEAFYSLKHKKIIRSQTQAKTQTPIKIISKEKLTQNPSQKPSFTLDRY